MGIKGKLIEMLSRARGCKVMSMLPTGIIDVVEWDLVTSVSVEHGGTIVDHPLEGDESFASSMYRAPTSINVEGIFTDTPIEFLAGVRPNATAKSKMLKILELRDREEPVAVVLSLGTFTSYGIEVLAFGKDPELGDGIAVSMSCRKLNIVSTALVPAQFDLDAQIAGAGGIADLGTQSPVDPRAYQGPTAITFPG